MARMLVSLLLFLVAAGGANAQPFQHSSGEWREYNRDWLASCPDTIDEDGPTWYSYSCFASTNSAEVNSANLPSYKLTLLRNRLNGVIELAITIAPGNMAYDQSRDMVLRFGGEAPIALRMGASLETRDEIINQFFVSDPELSSKIIETMKERTALTLSVPLAGRLRPVEVRLSLQGVMSSLDFMETYARRVAQY